MTFRVGQKVVCVDGRRSDGGTYPVKGAIYTVRWVGMFLHPLFGHSALCVHLNEIDRPIGKPAGVVIPYRIERFRPIAERKTDISIFTEMLTKTGVSA